MQTDDEHEFPLVATCAISISQWSPTYSFVKFTSCSYESPLLRRNFGISFKLNHFKFSSVAVKPMSGIEGSF